MSAPNFFIDTIVRFRNLLREDVDLGTSGGLLRFVEIVPDDQGFHVQHDQVPAATIVPTEEKYRTWSNARHELEARFVLQLWDVVGESGNQDFDGKVVPEWVARFHGSAERLKRFVWKNRTHTAGGVNYWFDVNRGTDFWRMRYDARIDKRGQVFVKADVELTLHRGKVDLTK